MIIKVGVLVSDNTYATKEIEITDDELFKIIQCAYDKGAQDGAAFALDEMKREIDNAILFGDRRGKE